MDSLSDTVKDNAPSESSSSYYAYQLPQIPPPRHIYGSYDHHPYGKDYQSLDKSKPDPHTPSVPTYRAYSSSPSSYRRRNIHAYGYHRAPFASYSSGYGNVFRQRSGMYPMGMYGSYSGHGCQEGGGGLSLEFMALGGIMAVLGFMLIPPMMKRRRRRSLLPESGENPLLPRSGLIVCNELQQSTT